MPESSMSEHGPQPHSELASFGEELRREREIRGISLKEISDSTKISKRFLEAIERNDHRTLPAPVFTRGFVREYARYLGLNAEEMVNRYNYAAAGDDRIEKSAHLDRLVQPAAPEPPKAKVGIPPPYARVDRNVLLLALIVVALVVVSVWAVRQKRRIATQPDHRAETTTVAAAQARPEPATAGSATARPTNTSALRLTLELSGDSWITLESDGKTVLNDELHRGDRRTFEAEREFRFRTIGNAAGVGLTLNDVRIPSLGDQGEVIRNRVFDLETLQRLSDDAPRSEG